MNGRLAVMVCLFLLCTLGGFAQNYQAATWYTTSGGLDTGVVSYDQALLESPDQFQYGYCVRRHALKKDFFACPHTDLEWLVVRGDTVLRAGKYEGEERIVQLLQAGQISLYATLEYRGFTNYLWYDQRRRQWHSLHPRKIRETGYEILRQNCKGFAGSYREKLWSEAYLINLTKALNKCLTAEESPRKVYSYTKSHRLGIGLMYIKGESQQETALQVAPHVLLGLRYQYQFSAWLQAFGVTAQLRVQDYRIDEVRPIRKGGFASRNTYYRERIGFQQAYLHAGWVWEPAIRRRWSPLIEFGGLMIIPSKFRRVTDYHSGAYLNGVPLTQDISFRPTVIFDAYAAYGLRYRLNTHWQLLVRLQQEQIEQDWERPANLIVTDNFRRANKLINDNQLLWHITLNYTW